MTNGTWDKTVEFSQEAKIMEFLTIKEVVKSLSLVSQKYHRCLNENANLVMLLISYDFGEIFEECQGLRKQLLAHEISGYQCIRLLYCQFDTLSDIKVPNFHFSSSPILYTTPNQEHCNEPLKDYSSDVTIIKNKNKNNNSLQLLLRKKQIHKKRKNTKVFNYTWNFSHLIGLKKSGCILHWLSYLPKLVTLSGYSRTLWEMTCDGDGVIQLQPIPSSNADLSEINDALLLRDDVTTTKSSTHHPKVVLSCALDLWQLCWRNGFSSSELAKLQQGLLQFQFRRW